MCGNAAGDHGSHAASESSQTHHHDVDQKEEHKKHGDEEMDGARGLLAAEHGDDGWNRGCDGRRHRQAGPDHQGKEHEDHEQVREALKYVVGPGIAVTEGLETPREIGPGGH